jgi:hypothetical protein
MNRALAMFNFKAKAVLCIILTAHLNLLVAGCGQNGLLGSTSVPVSSDLADTLAGTRFAGATSVEVNRIGKTFRLVQADGSSSISGSYTEVNGEYFITQFSVNTGTQAAVLSLNTNQEVVDITMQQQGSIFHRNTVSAQPAGFATAPRAPGKEINSYVAANADLLAQAQAADAQLGQKETQQGFFWVPFLAAFVLIPAGVYASILWTLTTIGGIALLLKK